MTEDIEVLKQQKMSSEGGDYLEKKSDEINLKDMIK